MDLNGPISSIKAVVNNDIGEDGVSEWDRLAGKPVIELKHQTIVEIYQEIKPLFNEFTQRPELQTDVELFKKFQEKLMNSMKESFEWHAPDAVSVIEARIDDNWKTFGQAFYGNKESFTALQAQQLFFEVLSHAEKNGAAALSSETSGMVIPIKDELSPRQIAAFLMGTDEVNLPCAVPGSKEEWQALVILHELEHLSDQSSKSIAHQHPHHAISALKTVKEIDSDHASLQLLKPLASSGLINYIENARVIGSLNTLTNILNSTNETTGTKIAYTHATGPSLKSIYGEHHTIHDVAENLSTLESLAKKIRAEHNIHHEHALQNDDMLSLKDIHNTLSELVAQKTIADMLPEFLGTESTLTDKETDIAVQYITALEETGFAEHWKNTEHSPLVTNCDTINSQITNTTSLK